MEADTHTPDFFANMLKEKGVSVTENNLFEATVNGSTYVGAFQTIMEIIDGGSSLPAEPMGPRDEKEVDTCKS